MPQAARVGDISSHGGTVTGPGAKKVFIENMPAAVMTDMHSCALPPDKHSPTTSPFTLGSQTVFIEGVPALRVGDSCGCGAAVVKGANKVNIG